MAHLKSNSVSLIAAALFGLAHTACSSSSGGDAGNANTNGTGTIGASGGTVSLPSGPSVQIPAGALSGNTTITVAASTITSPTGAVTPVFQFGPEGTTFVTPVTVSFTVPAGTTSANASVYWTKPGSTTQWDVLPATVTGTVATASVTHFSAGFVGAACATGTACAPTNACHTGTTTCNGTPACADTGTNVADGTTCGTGLTCTAGTCAGPKCTAGQTCTPTGTPDACKTYATACDSQGNQTCPPAANKADGSSCGTGLVCGGGTCNACVANEACASTTACHAAALDCSSGFPVCADTGAVQPDGTTCGGANTCAAGLCQAPCAAATVKTPATGSPAWSADFASWMTANGFAHVAANQGFGGGNACVATGRDPVILLHGNTIQADPTAGVVALKSKFVAGGYTDCDLFAITWIEQSAAQGDNHHKASYMKLVRDLVEAVKGYRGAAKVDVVGWSMGVGIARKAMKGGIAYSDPVRTLGCNLGPSMSTSVDTMVGVAGVARGFNGCATATSTSCSENGYRVDSAFLQDLNGGKAGDYTPAPVSSHVYSIYLPDDEFLCGDNPLGRGPIACEVYGTHTSIVPGSEFSRAYDLFNEDYGNNFGLNFNCTTDAFGKAVNCDHILVMNDAFSLDAIVRMVRDNETATLPPPPFAQADLAGAWDIVVHTSNDAAIWQAASVTIDGGGLMTFTSYVDSIGTTTVPGPGQTFIIDANGIVTTTGAGAVPSLHGMLSAQKTLLVGTMTFPGTPSSYGLFVLRKRVNGVTFSSADVANLALDFHQILSGGGTVWEYGLGSTNTAGALTIASVMTPTGPGTPPSAGYDTLQISPAGLVTMTTDTTFHGVMTADKKAVFGVGTRSGTIPSPYFTTLLLTGQSFAQADLSAVWEFHLLTSGANLAASNWFYGRVNIGSTGTVTSRYGLAPSGATLPAIGPLNLASDGTITSSGNTTYHGRMSWGKDFYVRTQTTSGASSLSLAVK